MFVFAARRALGEPGTSVPSRVVRADPANYRTLLRTLQPGDQVLLAPGLYSNGLPIHGMSGTHDARITIAGPEGSRRAIFLARPGAHTVSIADSAYVTIRGLYLDGRNVPVDGVRAEGNARWAHHITIENLVIVNHGADQQIVGISTKCPAWGWVIRGNQIVGAGTGLYFGDSDGSDPFIDGLIEGNRVVASIGYCMQIKHQHARPGPGGAPAADAFTVIRGNRFDKRGEGLAGELARPNVLVGHFPLEGPGSRDRYLLYGNVFEDNAHEALFQGEGNVALYNNLFVNRRGDAIRIQPHNHLPRTISIFGNTVLASGVGISVTGGEPGFRRYVGNNAVFAAVPLRGDMPGSNFTASLEQAAEVLRMPLASDAERDLGPKAGALLGGEPVPEPIRTLPDWNRDFLGHERTKPVFGACLPASRARSERQCR